MKRSLPSCLVLAICGVGCSYTPDHDYDVVASWLINGAAPDAERCSEVGIDRMRVELKGVGEPAIYDGPCEQLVVFSDGFTAGGLQTGVDFDYGVPYAYKLRALTKDGRTVQVYDSTVTAYYGDALPIALETVSVFEPRGHTAQFSAVWRFSPGDLAADCSDNEVDEVGVVLAAETDPDFVEPFELFRVACAKGSYDSGGKKILAQGRYLAKYVAYDARGGIAEQSKAYPLVIERGTTRYALDRHKFKGL